MSRAKTEEIAAQIDTSKLGWCIDAMEAYAAECVQEALSSCPSDEAINQMVEIAVSAERERCAKIAKSEPCNCAGRQGSCPAVVGLRIAKAIREQP